MTAVLWREFLSSFKSIKSIFTILIFIGANLGLAKLISIFYEVLKNLGVEGSPYSISFVFVTILISPFFIFSLSHNCVNEEIKNSTIRFIATKTERANIIIGKFLGMLLFWFLTLTITSLFMIIYSHSFYIIEILRSLIFICYFISLSILLSTIINSTALSNFLGIALSLIMTILGVWCVASENIFLKIYNFITPYYYFMEANNFLSLIVLIHIIIFLTISIILFRRRDL